jgi:hypothetical protein
MKDLKLNTPSVWARYSAFAPIQCPIDEREKREREIYILRSMVSQAIDRCGYRSSETRYAIQKAAPVTSGEALEEEGKGERGRKRKERLDKPEMIKVCT